jgi:hypothetical protein
MKKRGAPGNDSLVDGRSQAEVQLVAAWAGFAREVRGLTQRPWAEVQRAFLDDRSAEACRRVVSDCHFAVPLNHFIPGFLSNSVAIFQK